jgi:hypothetical protein
MRRVEQKTAELDKERMTMQPRRKLLPLLSLLALSTFACQLAGLQPTPTPTATLPAPTVTATPVPTPTPLVVESLCLEVETLNRGTNSSGDIQAFLKGVLGTKGLDILSLNKDTCDSTLAVKLSFATSSAQYKDADGGGLRTCFTGVSGHGEMTFTMQGAEPRVYRINTVIAPPSGTIYGCPARENDANLDPAWADDILDGLYDLFGPDVLAHALFYNSRDGSPWVAEMAGTKLQNLGPKALPSVPVILRYMNERYGSWDALPEEYTPILDPALNILRNATGQDLGRDLDAWNTWWQSQQ